VNGNRLSIHRALPIAIYFYRIRKPLSPRLRYCRAILLVQKVLIPAVEQALVVPAFRKCYQDPSCNSNLKGVSLKKSFPRMF